MASIPSIIDFRKKYVHFSFLLLEEISQRWKGSGSLASLEPRFRFFDNYWTNEPHHFNVYEKHIPLFDDPFFQNTETQSCARAFFESGFAAEIQLSDNDGNRINEPTFEQLCPFIFWKLVNPVRQLIGRHQTLRLTKRTILTCLDRYIMVWLGKGDSDPRYAPIFNFDTTIKSIKLTDFVSIVPFTNRKKAEIIDAAGPFGRNLHIQNYAESSHVAVLRALSGSSAKDKRKEITKDARHALQAAITSLRLAKTEMIGTMGFISVPKLTMEYGASINPLEGYDLPTHSIFRPRYELNHESTSVFRRNYRMLCDDNFLVWNSLMLPIRQFNRSCQREREEDKILDYTIALESVLLRDVGEELSYRLALRGANLLRRTRDPKTTFDRIRCLYKIRSYIVHEGQTSRGPKAAKAIKNIGMQPHQFMQSLEVLVRDLLQEIIRRIHKGTTLKTLCIELDNSVWR